MNLTLSAWPEAQSRLQEKLGYVHGQTVTADDVVRIMGSFDVMVRHPRPMEGDPVPPATVHVSLIGRGFGQRG